MKKVAIDSGPLRSGDSVRGIGVHTRELAKALEEIDTGEIKIDFIDFKSSDLSKYDLVHYQKFNPYKISIPFLKPTKTIITIHDVIYLQYADKYPPGIRGKIELGLQNLILKRVDGVITISQSAKKDISKYLDISPEKIFVIHLAHPQIFNKNVSGKLLAEVKSKYNLPEKFVLYCGDINYNKNMPSLLEACRLAKAPLVIVGKNAKDIEGNVSELKDMHGPNDWIRFLRNIPHPEIAHYEELVLGFKKNDVLRLGYIPYNEYFAVMKLASVYCQLSFNEGFGIGLLEAMAAGIPVVCSDIPVFRETAGEACVYVVPKDAKEAAAKIKKFISDPVLTKKYSEMGVKQSEKYSWKKTASETIAIYNKF